MQQAAAWVANIPRRNNLISALGLTKASAPSTARRSAAAWLLNQVGLLWHHLAEWTRAEPLNRRALNILIRLTRATGHQHPHLQFFVNNYTKLARGHGRIRSRNPGPAAATGPGFLRRPHGLAQSPSPLFPTPIAYRLLPIAYFSDICPTCSVFFFPFHTN